MPPKMRQNLNSILMSGDDFRENFYINYLYNKILKSDLEFIRKIPR